jgi:hypothetical protein
LKSTSAELALIAEIRQAITHRLQLLIELRDGNLHTTLANMMKELEWHTEPPEPKTKA